MVNPPQLRAWRAAWSAIGQVSPSLEPRPGGAYDRLLVDRMHRSAFGKSPDLQHPRTYVEKMAWQKLYHRNPLMVLCSDKVKVRDYVRHQGFERMLVPGAQVYPTPDEIRWDRLPERFVLKPNHGSQWVVLCPDRESFDRSGAVKRLRRWMRRNYSLFYAETNYRGIERRVLAEPFMGQFGTEVHEHKFFCFHGEPKFISAIVGRDERGLLRQIYDPEWQPLDIGSRGVKRVPIEIPRPDCFEEMLAAARILSKPFMHVRVDFLVANGRPFFGELTFYNFAGVRPLEPESAEEWAGSLWDVEASEECCAIGRELASLIRFAP